MVIYFIVGETINILLLVIYISIPSFRHSIAHALQYWLYIILACFLTGYSIDYILFSLDIFSCQCKDIISIIFNKEDRLMLVFINYIIVYNQ